MDANWSVRARARCPLGVLASVIALVLLATACQAGDVGIERVSGGNPEDTGVGPAARADRALSPATAPGAASGEDSAAGEPAGPNAALPSLPARAPDSEVAGSVEAAETAAPGLPVARDGGSGDPSGPAEQAEEQAAAAPVEAEVKSRRPRLERASRYTEHRSADRRLPERRRPDRRSPGRRSPGGEPVERHHPSSTTSGTSPSSPTTPGTSPSSPTTPATSPSSSTTPATSPSSSTTPATSPSSQQGSDQAQPAPPADPGAPADRVITSADQSTVSSGFTVPAGQIWELDPSQSVSLDVSGNVVVNGTLRMRPANGSIVHRLRFVNVDESRFVGGGHDVLDSDVGLWVVGAGQLDLQGQRRTGWTTLQAGVQRGATQLTLATAPTGWSVGDEITITPTVGPDATDSHAQFDERTITSIDGRVIGLSAPLGYDHPTVNGTWNAEVLNLTRNVRIEGTGDNGHSPSTNGRAHVFIHSSSPQSIRYVQLRHLGPRVAEGGGTSEGVTGRYSLHFHHNGDASRGSIVEGVVVRNSGNSAYVPHASNGITIRDSIAYDGWENALWWDPPTPRNGAARLTNFTNDSHDILIDHVAVAGLRSSGRSGGYLLSAFTLAGGTNLTLRNSVAIGVEGWVNTSGYHWPEQSNTNKLWVFENNVAHNNTQLGIFVWQNTPDEHVISDFVGYHNGRSGIAQGAYVTAFQYFDTQLYGNGSSEVEQHSGAHGDRVVKRADGYTLVYENLRSNGPLEIQKQAVPSGRPVLFRNCSFTHVDVRNTGDGKGGHPGQVDFVDCGLQPSDFRMTSAMAGTQIRVQNGSDAYSIGTDGSVRSIAPFYSPNG